MLCGLEAGCELLGSGGHGHGHVQAGAQTGSGHRGAFCITTPQQSSTKTSAIPLALSLPVAS